MKSPFKERLLTDAAVERVDAQTVRIYWETVNDTLVKVYAGESPEAFDRTGEVGRSSDGCIKVYGLDKCARYYFLLEAGGDRLVTAERKVCMDGAVNFRDLGGYRTAEGFRVKWGRIFRSDGLSRLSGPDLDRLKHMGITRVYDFRTSSEMEGLPDRLPADGSVEHIHLPVSHGRFDFAEAVRMLQNGEREWLTSDFMVKGYIRNLEKYPEIWAAVIRDLAKPKSEPIVFHCTGGKDRTGTCAALMLMALGVPEEIVVGDHQLSNIYIARLLPGLYKQMEEAGIEPDSLFPWLTAPRECIIAVLEHIIDKYGSAADYLFEKAGLQIYELERLQRNLLE